VNDDHDAREVFIRHIAQHHDAVSGAETQNAADDYAQRLSYEIDVAVVSK
jgi:hypothetical protein